MFSLQCPFINMQMESDTSMFNMNLMSDAMKLLVESISHRIGFSNEYQSISNTSSSDIRFVLQTIKLIYIFII